MTATERLAAFRARTPYLAFLGLETELHGDDLTAILPFDAKLVGNPFIPAVHGGVVGALMELTALGQLWVGHEAARAPKTIDVTIEYLRPVRAKTTYARAAVRKPGRRIANVHVEAWQDSPDQPVAFLRGHFLLGPDA